MERGIAAASLCYFIVKLSLFLIAVVTVFLTILLLPPPILKICALLLLAVPGGLLSSIADKSISQKRE